MLTASLAALALSVSSPNPVVTVTGTSQDQTSAVAQMEPHRLDDLPVEGRTRDRIIRDFVENVADPVPGRTLSRWRRDVCVSVANMRPQTAQLIVDRISTVADDLGLRPGAPGCRPNILIVASANPKSEAERLVATYGRDILPNMTGATQGRAGLRAFQESDAPIRWWYVNMITDQFGVRATRKPGDSPADKLYDHEGLMNHVMASRLLSNYSDDLVSAVVIVDPTRLEHMNNRQLADYLSFITMAQISPTADTSSYDSILNAQDSELATAELTDWDWAYLRGLYSVTRTLSNIRASSSQVQRQIARASDRIQAERRTDAFQ